MVHRQRLFEPSEPAGMICCAPYVFHPLARLTRFHGVHPSRVLLRGYARKPLRARRVPLTWWRLRLARPRLQRFAYPDGTTLVPLVGTAVVVACASGLALSKGPLLQRHRVARLPAVCLPLWTELATKLQCDELVCRGWPPRGCLQTSVAGWDCGNTPAAGSRRDCGCVLCLVAIARRGFHVCQLAISPWRVMVMPPRCADTSFRKALLL